MGRIGKISAIKKRYPNGERSIEATLANTYNMTRFPGSGVTKLPYRQGDGTYRTGLEDKPNEKERLEKALRVSLDPASDYYNYRSEAIMRVNPVKLKDGDNIFNLDDPEQAVTFYWLSVHPTIASSWDAWEAGQYPSDTPFYVNNEDIEQEREYKRNTAEAKAIIKLDALSIEKMRKVARQLGFPVSDDSKPEHVYPKIYDFVKQGLIKAGPYKNHSSIDVFNDVISVNDTKLHLMDLVSKALDYNLFRISAGGRLMKGEQELAKSREDYLEFLGSPKGQEDLLQLEKDLNVKQKLIKSPVR